MDYWLHRISHHAEFSHPLLDQGFLTIGFAELSNQETINAAISDNWNNFNDQFNHAWGTIPRTRHNLWNFLHFKKGDIVIVPSWGVFHVCEILSIEPKITSELPFDELKSWNGESLTNIDGNWETQNGDILDLGFFWEIKVLHKNVSRDKFADSKLTSRMKVRQTCVSINDLSESIENAIQNFTINKPIHLHSIILDKIVTTINDTVKTHLNPDKFERLIKLYFKKIGATEITIPPKNEVNKEGDADIVAVFENIKLIIYVQAKFQIGTISEWGTTQVKDYLQNKDSIDDGYNKIAWVITTADNFNVEAQNLAKENQLQLINGSEFSKMLINAGISSLEKGL